MTLGFAIIDCWSGSPNAAIWHVSRVTQSEADKTNAVLLRKDSDNDFDKKVEALTHSRILLCTEGSDIAELALASEVTNVRFLFNFIKIAEDLQERIIRAVDDYAARTNNKTLIRPDIAVPNIEVDMKSTKSAIKRALLLADATCKVWTFWLRIERERVRRTVQPGTGITPWIMPPELNQHSVAALPDFSTAKIRQLKEKADA